uniref:Phosphoric ester n=1 Tax=Colletotrichum fructicola (strain Nara gc5) TaxID=1213859 RepID=L2FS89_COLFN
MTLLTALGLRRKNDWEPPTLLDSLLISPLHLLVTIIYSILLFLRGRPFRPPRDKPAIRVVCLSDTHDQINLDWLASFPPQHKILVCGNHDSFFDLSARRPEDRGKTLDFKGIRYLVHDAVTLEFKGGRRLKIYGSPDIPACGGPEMAFQYDRASPPWANTVPIDTDILVTHAPPKHHLDLGLGCAGLLEEVWRVRPKLHVFGHVHWGHGRQTVHFDDCQRAYETLIAQPPRGLVPHSGGLGALRVLGYGIHGVIWKWLMIGPGGNTSSLMVNAAQMYGNTGRLGNPVEVVDL